MTDAVHAELVAVLAGFTIADELAFVEPLTSGHIHDTWAVTAGYRRYVAQRINGEVFGDLDACEHNLSRIDAVLVDHPAVAVPRLARTSAGAVHWTDASGRTWRLAAFAEGTVAGVFVADAAQAYDVAMMFGRYAASLDAIVGELRPTIARFHDLDWRLAQLDRAAVLDPRGRLDRCRTEVVEVGALATRIADELAAAQARNGPCPMRVAHNDAKVANVRFDAASGRAAMIVDLDTTMPGSILFDVGELLRTATVVVAEDAPDVADVSDVEVDEARVAAVVRGMLEGSGGELTVAERAALAQAGPLMAIENAVRFLTDHLAGDGYYGAARPGQNLDRARTQGAVASALLACAGVVDAAAR